jgi:hypothetical protein
VSAANFSMAPAHGNCLTESPTSRAAAGA